MPLDEVIYVPAAQQNQLPSFYTREEFGFMAEQGNYNINELITELNAQVITPGYMTEILRMINNLRNLPPLN